MTFVLDWRTRLGLRATQAAAELGISTSALSQYERGIRRGDGASVAIPRHIGLACSAIAFGLPPYDELSDAAADRLAALERALAAPDFPAKLAAARAFVDAADWAGSFRPTAGRT